MLTCPTPEQMNRMAEGDLSPLEIDALERHLEQCAACAGTVQLLADSFTLETPQSNAAVESLIETLQVLRPNRSSDRAFHYLAPAERPDEIGRFGPYRLLSIIGRGGMGVVFEAEASDSTEFGASGRVAIKVMQPALLPEPTAHARFLREAAVAAEIRHPNVVVTHRVGEEAGVPFLVMELLQGETLEERLKREPTISVPETLRIGREIADGLAAAHQHGLIHRDVKPSNVWIETSGHVKLLDFGLARPMNENSHLTRTGIFLGTPAFISPEQASGGDVEFRSDLFSLGCVLFRMTTGEIPFPGKDAMTIVWALASKRPTPPRQLNPTIPPALSHLIFRLLAKDPAKRPSSAAEVRDELEEISGSPRPRRLRTGVLFGGVVAIGVLLLAILFGRSPTLPEAIPPAVATPEPKPSFALEFDGAAYVSIDDFPLPKDGPYTIEAILTVKQTSPNRSAVIGAGKDARAHSIEISSFRRLVPTWRYSWSFPRAVGSAPVVVDQRCHVAATRSPNRAEIFVNGKSEGWVELPAGTPDADRVPLKIGVDFVGVIERLRISRRVRYDADFLPIDDFSNDPDTLALYRFAEGSGDVLRDSSGNERHGKLHKATWVRIPNPH